MNESKRKWESLWFHLWQLPKGLRLRVGQIDIDTCQLWLSSLGEVNDQIRRCIFHLWNKNMFDFYLFNLKKETHAILSKDFLCNPRTASTQLLHVRPSWAKLHQPFPLDLLQNYLNCVNWNFVFVSGKGFRIKVTGSYSFLFTNLKIINLNMMEYGALVFHL